MNVNMVYRQGMRGKMRVYRDKLVKRSELSKTRVIGKKIMEMAEKRGYTEDQLMNCIFMMCSMYVSKMSKEDKLVFWKNMEKGERWTHRSEGKEPGENRDI